MSQPPPPPPPPHGENPKTTSGGGGGGLGPGNYDIFVIPQRDKGGGFIYLPAMTASGPSFAAGFASALVLVVLFQSMAPAFQAWWNSFQGMGNMGMTLLIIAVGVGAWAWGKSQGEFGPDGGSGAGGTSPGAGAGAGAGTTGGQGSGTAGNTSAGGNATPGGNSPPTGSSNTGHTGTRSGWQQHQQQHQHQQQPPPQPGHARADGTSPKNAWERAREETRKKEEERKAKEADEKRKADAARRVREFREKEAREREKREQEAKEREELKQKLEKERAEREKLEKEKADREARDQAEKRKRELEDQRKREAEERKKRDAEEAARTTTARQGSTYAYSGVGEKTNPWPNGKPPTPPSSAFAANPPPPAAPKSSYSYSSYHSTTSQRVPPKRSPSPTKPAPSVASSNANTNQGGGGASRRPPAPSARTHLGPDDDDMYSYRPYDQPSTPKRSGGGAGSAAARGQHRKAPSSVGSEASWAPSATTAHTTPPPSMRGPYTTKDPDKIVIKAVYLFMNQFAKTPASNLLSGIGTVTDGLILRITTEGLFIDDDVRGVPQREWDVKAWTLKTVEVWCPPHCLSASSSSASSSSSSPASNNVPSSFFQRMAAGQRARAADRGAGKALTGEEAEALLTEMLRACQACCRLGLCESHLAGASGAGGAGASSRSSNTDAPSSWAGQTGAWKAKGLHLVRATIRDQEGKRYLFVVDEEEAWKVAVGVNRLRKGRQAQALGVAGMSAADARGTLGMLGWV